MKLDIKKLQEKVKKNDSNSCFLLGLEYYKGEILKQNIPLAAELIMKSIKLGVLEINQPVKLKIGSLFYIEFFSDVNPKLNINYVLGSMYARKKDYKKAIACFKKGYKEGSIQCCTALGLIYYDGKIVKRDIKRGYELIRQAQFYGYPPANYIWRVFKQRGIRPK